MAVRQHTQDVRVCSSAHTRRLCVSMCAIPHTQDVCGCPSVHISARWSLDSARCPFLWTVWMILAHVGCLFGTHMTSVGVRQHTQDVRCCGQKRLRRNYHPKILGDRISERDSKRRDVIFVKITNTKFLRRSILWDSNRTNQARSPRIHAVRSLCSNQTRAKLGRYVATERSSCSVAT